MREIKFRAWHNTQNVMLQVGDDYGTENPLDCVMYKLGGQDVVLMQYTGLKDKNGREIYEGDVIKTKMIVFSETGHYSGAEEVLGTVKYENGKFGLSFQDGKFFDLSFGSAYHEIIGNIYENPELLKGEST